jgi:hypothetical protein
MRKKMYIAVLAFLCLCLFSCDSEPDAPDEGFGTIFGFVTDFRDVGGNPVRDANVQLRPTGQTIKTGSDGRFQFSDVKAGNYSITVTKSCYTDLVDPYNITVTSNGRSQRDVMIDRQPCPLRLVASDGTTNDITGLNFGSAQDTRSFGIFNPNPYALEWTIVNNTEWIIVNQSSGTVAPSGGQQAVTVTINRGKQPEGVFSATISVISASGTRDLAVSTQVVSLSLNANPAMGGTVSPASQSNIAPGTQVNISAAANSGYTFVNWMVTNGQAQIANENNAVTTVVLSSDATIRANFQSNTTANPTGKSLPEQLRELYANAKSGDEYTIELTGNENIGAQPLSFSDRSDITIKLIGNGGERIIQLTDNGSLFTIGTGVTLILDNRVTLRGRSGNNAPLIRVNSRGTLIMKSGAKVSNNSNSNSGGGVFVATDGSFTMEGGEISGNNSSGYNSGGGGVYVASGGFFSMENGRISSNTSSSGGGVYVAEGNFTMKDGEIINNTASTGGGVEVGNGSFTMEGGKISGNTSNSSSYGGGGVYVGNAVFTMDGGEISGNTAGSGGGVFVVNNGTFAKTNGTIYGYTMGDSKRNTATAGISGNDKGHAVFVNSNPNKRRETTAGDELALDSKITGAAGGWE